MRAVKMLIIMVFVAAIIAGCGQIEKEYEQQATSPPILTRVPTPEVTEGGFAYKDQFLSFITVIEGEGWEVEKYYEDRQVVFKNANSSYDNYANTIFVMSTVIIGDIDHLRGKWWADLSDHYQAENVTTAEVEIGYEATEIPMKGIEYIF